MARRVFFSFDYQDVIDFRANVVRNSWLTKQDREDAGFFDASIWEASKKKGDLALKRLINDSLENTSVTCVLIGMRTFSRRWVRYETLKSYSRSNGLLGIYIHNIRDKGGRTSTGGLNPFDFLAVNISRTGDRLSFLEYNGDHWISYQDLNGYCVSNVSKEHWGRSYKLSQFCKVYDWVYDNGVNNIGNWVEMAASQAGR